ncbi:MAG: hypothetical protein D6743_06375 [Calditrichaeota bacterium]|nr:MAG: hypothetical protein D6743_06375 [Calditrichota bacterium]
MQFARRFWQKFSTLIVAILCSFDRVIFKGYMFFGDDDRLNGYVDRTLKMRRVDFIPWLRKQSQRLVDHARQLAQQHGRPYLYRQGRFRKETLIHKIIREDRLSEGLVAVLCVQETCRTVKLKWADRRPRLVFARRPHRVLYFYWLDPSFGLIYVRLQTWFPYVIQVYVNGHDWLARQMERKGLGFVQRDNAFLALDDPKGAQKLAHRFARLRWVRILDRWARQVNPLIRGRGPFARHRYWWVTEQAEYATDVLFHSPQALRGLYPRLLDHAAVNFSASDILTFLGRKLHGNFQGEVLTSLQKKRWPGARIKHRMKENWLKMYDKFGILLRVETVINQPEEFRVYRLCRRQGRQQWAWCPMRKGVANLPSYQKVSLAANQRYLEALSVVGDPAPAYRRVAELARSKSVRGRSYAGFNPACRDDVRLFQAVLSGDHLLRGFRNADIRRLLYGEHPDAHERQRQANRVTRLLKRLHVRGLIAKIPRTRRWRVSPKGHKLLGTILQLHYHGLPQAA